MREPTVIPPGGGEIIGDAPDRRVEILSEHDSLHATWSRFGPRREGADLHIHQHHTDLFYILEGEMTVLLGADGDGVTVPAGTLARVPPLVAHGFRNRGDAELRYLNLHAPGMGFADYMRGLRDGRDVAFDQEPPPADGGRPAAEAVVGEEPYRAGGVGLLADVAEIGIAETWMDPDSPAPPTHLHRRHVESFYVLEGELALSAGDEELRAPAGSWLQIPLHVPHTVWAAGSERLRFLNLHTPSCGFGAFVRAPEDAKDRAGFDEEPA